jgi:hypothetical protein
MATKPLEKGGGIEMHALSRRMQCGCADRRAANGGDVADMQQLGILRMLDAGRWKFSWRFCLEGRPRCCGLRSAAADDVNGEGVQTQRRDWWRF